VSAALGKSNIKWDKVQRGCALVAPTQHFSVASWLDEQNNNLVIDVPSKQSDHPVHMAVGTNHLHGTVDSMHLLH
jgi:hypothetical protein